MDMAAPLGNLNSNKYCSEYAKQAYKLCLMGARDQDLVGVDKRRELQKQSQREFIKVGKPILVETFVLMNCYKVEWLYEKWLNKLRVTHQLYNASKNTVMQPLLL